MSKQYPHQLLLLLNWRLKAKSAERISSAFIEKDPKHDLSLRDIEGVDPQRPFRRLAQDTGKATICDELGVDVQLMPVCESINEADDVRLRNTSALDPRGGVKV